MKILLALAVIFVAATCPVEAQPSGYYRYGKDCARAQQKVWGMTYWSSVMLAQVEQESGWRPRVCSPYACGLTQFTPGTKAGVERQHGLTGSLWDPEYACTLQAYLMRDLARQVAPVFKGFYSQWGATLRCYNGSPRSFWQEWVRAGRPTNVFAMEGTCVRRAAFCRENWDYPRRILFRHWPKYRMEWGA